MVRNNETVAEIMKRVWRECNSYPLPTNAAEMLRLVREISAAHKREIAAKDAEIAELRAKWHEALNIADSVEKCASIERQTEAMLKKNEVICGLRKQIAELQRRLKVAEDAVESMRKVFGHTGDTDAISMCDYAIAAIRGEGGKDAH